MNIFIVSRGYPERHDPQWGIFEALQADALRRLGHKVTILAVDSRLRFYPRKIGVRHLMAANAYIYHLFPFRLIGFSKNLTRRTGQWMLRRLFRYVASREGMPDVVYAHYLNNMLHSLPLRNEFGGVLVGIEHWSEMMKEVISPDIEACAREVYPKLDSLLTVSGQLQEAILKRFGTQAETVPNMVSEDFISAPRRLRRGGRFEFSSVGRLVDWKHFDMVIRASATLRDRGYDFGVTIIGGGEEEQNLRQLIERLDIGSHVKLAGVLTRDRIIDIHAHSDAFVLPSDHETFGVAIIEAMAMGLPVIACNAGGPIEIVDDSNGILIPPLDQNALVDAMARMIDDSRRYDSERIAADCARKYAPQNVARRIEDIFARTIRRKKEKL